MRHLSFSAATTKTENTIGIDNNSSSLMFALWIHQALWQWSTYACTVCLFHMMEFFITCVYNPTIASGDSFLINHSTAYTVAAITSWIEFFLRKIMTLILLSFVSSSNNNTILSIIERMYPWYWYMSLFGWILALMGQSIRSIAMMTASKNFNHYIQTRRQNNHQLVTHGIYSHLRHPSYSGFFFWSIGTQFLLGNILHTMLYTGASWKFFHDRIAYEEESLCQLFPNEYIHYIYNGNTYTGIPFIYTKQQRPPQNTTNASDEPTTREKIQ